MKEDAHTLIVSSLSQCISPSNRVVSGDGEDDNDHRANVLKFILSSDKLPQFAIRALNFESDTKTNFASRIGFDRIVEVEPSKVDATDAFNATSDNVLRTLLNDDVRQDKVQWTM